MSKYKINIMGLHPTALMLKLKIEAMVNQSIMDCYYNEKGDFNNFYKRLNIIKTNFIHLNNDSQIKILLNHFLKDVRAFKYYFKDLKKLAYFCDSSADDITSKPSNFNNY